MTRNLTREVARAVDSAALRPASRWRNSRRPIRPSRSKSPTGSTSPTSPRPILAATPKPPGPCAFPDQGSNNWVVDGSSDRDRQAAARQRSAPPGADPLAAQDRAPGGAGLERHRRRRARAARHRARPQRPHRLRLHHRRHRPAGPLRREAEPGQPRRIPLPGRLAQRGGRAADASRCAGAAAADRRAALHGARADHPRGPRAAARLRAAWVGSGTGHGRVSGRAGAGARAQLEGVSGRHRRATKCRAKTWSTPTWRATSAGRRRDSRRCARTGPGCCRCPATRANTSGAASARSTNCRACTTRRSTSSPPPTTTSCRRATRCRWATSGRRRSATSASGRCWPARGSSPSRISSACSRTWFRCRRAAFRRC